MHFLSESRISNFHVFTNFHLKSSFLRVDQRLFEICNTHKVGTTVSMVIATKDTFIFVNLGDSRAILCGAKKIIFETKDHRPIDEAEKQRIEAAGGVVGRLCDLSIWRINSNLAVSRALGDHHFKVNDKKGKLFSFGCVVFFW